MPYQNLAVVAWWLCSKIRNRRVMSSSPSVTEDPPCRGTDEDNTFRGRTEAINGGLSSLKEDGWSPYQYQLTTSSFGYSSSIHFIRQGGHPPSWHDRKAGRPRQQPGQVCGGRNSHLSIENKVLLYTAVMRLILAYASPVWGYAAKTNINKLDTLQNSLIRMIVKATRYMRNDDIRKDLKIYSFKSYIQNTAINFFTNLDTINNVNIQNLIPYTPNDNTKRPRRILLGSYNPP
ncbi:uncharacterized protein TNCV_1967791 [Trichonephila clavipes]|nr:uncharacterized protein TNCV_1967791 [Trichonephila clavipes]